MASLVTNARAQRHNTLNLVGTTLLGELLEAASDWVVAYCRNTFATDTLTEIYNGDGTIEMVLDHLPVTDVDNVVVLCTDDPTITIDNSADDQLRVDADTGIIQVSPNHTSDIGYFPKGFQNITVEYTAGYAAVPEAVQEAICQVAIAFYRMGSSAKNPAFDSEKLGEYSYKVRKDADAAGGILTKTTLQTLSVYRVYGRN